MAKGEAEGLKEYRRKRDFSKTAEPAGSGSAPGAGELRFVIQKHAASHLHYDLRLEMGGVMRSWAVPKGPSLDPKVRRLAMEVEDHPIEYNQFEGTIPQGEYGGGTVMLWDEGTYTPDEIRKGETPEKAAIRAYKKGKLSFTFYGERLHGSFGLVRTDTVEGGVRSKWLFFKHSDPFADPETEITEEVMTSVTTGRTMEEIAAGKGGKKVWQSNRDKPKLAGAGSKRKRRKAAGPDMSSLLPMLAKSTGSIPDREDWVFEPKYDGIRVLAFATPGSVALVTRNGHDKAKQFPEIVEALEALVADIGGAAVLDGEVVPLVKGKVGRFELLQGRMHVSVSKRIADLSQEQPAALVCFDVLLVEDDVLIHQSWTERRARLEEVLDQRTSATIRISEVADDQKELVKRGQREGWEGVMAKRRDARYRPGQRSADWLKLKLENQQEFVVGGWTEPRRTRSHLGAILLGYYDADGKLVYAGHTGTGFDSRSLSEMSKQLKRLERKTPPFTEKPRTNEKAHWTTPKVVVQVKFNEWTKDGKLRQPVFLGIREDKDPKEVVRENGVPPEEDGGRKAPRRKASPKPAAAEELDTGVAKRVREIGAGKGEGKLKIGSSTSIPVSSLGKVFYPETGHTKQDLLVYYSRMADVILPWMQDRPLVLKRFPNGVDEESFYQQAAPDSAPAGVRIETIMVEGKKQRRLIGGNLETLLYTVQLGAISYDPWHSRITDLESADYTILDLDPGPGATFQTVIKVARLVKEEMDRLGVAGALKTSGSSGLHIYLPLPAGMPLEAATLIAQIIATRVARNHPEVATVERMTKNRPKGTIYVDYLQNILGKTVAGVYAVRAKPQPTVSTPLAWEELTDDLDLRDFTIDTVPARVRQVGDLWTPAMSEPISLEALLEAHGKAP